MVHCTKLIKELEEFMEKYSINEPVQFSDEYQTVVAKICNELSFLKITFNGLNSESQILIILKYAYKIMKQFHITDILRPLNNINYVLYMQLSQRIANLKSLILSEILIEGSNISNYDHLLDYKLEQYICDNYKSKFEEFKVNHNEEELFIINMEFSSFLFEFVKMLSNLSGKDTVPIKKNVNLILDVANLLTLLENIHHIFHLISDSEKIGLLRNITRLCIDQNIDMTCCKFLSSLSYEFKIEICIMSYFILQHISKHLVHQKLHQTSKILSRFTVENMNLVDLDTSNSEFNANSVESVKLITCKTYNKIKTVHSPKIMKCIEILQLFVDSLSDFKIYNCPFAIILLSMLYEFVMGTNLDEITVDSMMELVIGCVQLCDVPDNFTLASYLINIYQRLKYSKTLKLKFMTLCKNMSNHLNYLNQDFKNDLERVINDEENWVDKSIILSCVLNNIDDTLLKKDEILYNLYCTFNEHIVLLSYKYEDIPKKLISAYSVSLNFSLLYKNEDCLFNNLAILDKYSTIVLENNENWQLDYRCFIETILEHYDNINKCLPDEFMIKCWQGAIKPLNMGSGIADKLLKLCSPKTLIRFIDILQTETIKIIEGNEMSRLIYLLLRHIWNVLLNMEFMNQKKKIRKDHINHFCFILNKTFLFNTNKIKSNNGLMLLLNLVSLLLKLSWVNKTILMNCSFRLLTFVEKSSVSGVTVLTEAAELLIVLYKCPNLIKPFLGLYVTSFIYLLKKCWSFVLCLVRSDEKPCYKNYVTVFHKLEKCSNLFKQNKSDFDIICPYIIENLIQLISMKDHLPQKCMRHCYNIVFNLIEICSPEEMKQLISNIQGPALLILRSAYREYRSNIRFDGRL